MRAALDHLASVETGGRRIAILGGMAELGPDAPEYHREMGAHARELGIGPVIGVGEMARDYAPDEWAPDPEAGAELADGLLADGDAVLVKGSRSVGLELLTDSLAARRT
jgi:UDP-N-acetylmuramoyl-tripeptide--D-alanyl-D-alanine ligase